MASLDNSKIMAEVRRAVADELWLTDAHLEGHITETELLEAMETSNEAIDKAIGRGLIRGPLNAFFGA